MSFALQNKVQVDNTMPLLADSLYPLGKSSFLDKNFLAKTPSKEPFVFGVETINKNKAVFVIGGVVITVTMLAAAAAATGMAGYGIHSLAQEYEKLNEAEKQAFWQLMPKLPTPSLNEVRDFFKAASENTNNGGTSFLKKNPNVQVPLVEYLNKIEGAFKMAKENNIVKFSHRLAQSQSTAGAGGKDPCKDFIENGKNRFELYRSLHSQATSSDERTKILALLRKFKETLSDYVFDTNICDSDQIGQIYNLILRISNYMQGK
jgi:hypothetical protein